jgi:hypothetical protein
MHAFLLAVHRAPGCRMAQRSDLQPVDHRSEVSAGSGCLAERCAASDPNLHPGQLDRVAALELEATGRLTVEVDRRAPVSGRPRATRNHNTVTPEWEPWGSAHAYKWLHCCRFLLQSYVYHLFYIYEHRLSRA